MAEQLSAASDGPLEVTSSGLTHDCTDGGIPRHVVGLHAPQCPQVLFFAIDARAAFVGCRFVCEGVMALWPRHRPHAGAWYARPNFGSLHVRWPVGDARVCPLPIDIEVHGLEGQTTLHARRDACESNPLDPSVVMPLDGAPLDRLIGICLLWVVGALHVAQRLRASPDLPVAPT